MYNSILAIAKKKKKKYVKISSRPKVNHIISRSVEHGSVTGDRQRSAVKLTLANEVFLHMCLSSVSYVCFCFYNV